MGRPCIISKEYHQEIIDLYKTGNYSMTELAKMYGATNRQPVITILKQNEVETIDRRSIQGSDLQKVETMVNEGLSKPEIARQLDVSQKAITTAIDRLDVEYEPQIRTYHFDETIFDVIDTEEKAYWLAFLYADAHAYRTSTRIVLSAKDENHLMKLKDFVNGDMPITTTIYKTTSLELNSIYMVKQMHKLGVIPYRGKFYRTLKALPNHLFKHFIRGYIDGDGCISNNYQVSILGQKDAIKWIRKQLCDSLDINKNKLRERGKVVEISWGGKNVFSLITEYLYKDASIYLDRKMERIKNQTSW